MYHQRPCGCPQSGQLPKTMLILEGYAELSVLLTACSIKKSCPCPSPAASLMPCNLPGQRSRTGPVELVVWMLMNQSRNHDSGRNRFTLCFLNQWVNQRGHAGEVVLVMRMQESFQANELRSALVNILAYETMSSPTQNPCHQ